MRRALLIGSLTAALVGAGCGDDESSAGETTQAAQPAEKADGSKPAAREQQPAGVKIKTAPSQFGKVLFSGSDRAIYYFDKESTSKSECYGACAKAWPPVLTDGKPQAAGRVKQGLLGTKKRANGKKQVTYDGHPLYFYVSDPRGEVECHNIFEFRGLWLAVKPNGGTPPT
jgi:predicted lipoprotein with Yx(FWY)xxD motif